MNKKNETIKCPEGYDVDFKNKVIYLASGKNNLAVIYRALKNANISEDIILKPNGNEGFRLNDEWEII